MSLALGWGMAGNAWTVEAAGSARRLEAGGGREQESRMIPGLLNGNLRTK